MKSLEETIKYIEMELKILSLENLNVGEGDTKRDVTYKNTQIGKRIAYEKMLAFIKDEHKVNSRYLRKVAKNAQSALETKEVVQSKESMGEDNCNKKPIIVCV